MAACGAAAEVLAQRDLLPEEDRDEAGALVELTLVGEDEFGLSLLTSAAGEWRAPRVAAAPGARVRARIRARDVMLALERPVGISALNVLAGTVASVAAGEGPDALVAVDCGGERLLARVTRRSVAGLELAPGRAVFAIVKAVTFDRGNSPSAMPRLA